MLMPDFNFTSLALLRHVLFVHVEETYGLKQYIRNHYPEWIIRQRVHPG